ALAGDPVLESFVFKGDLPVLGHVELATSVFFDMGVYLLIIGVVLELLRTLGTAVDKEADAERAALLAPIDAPAGALARTSAPVRTGGETQEGRPL
ncbi:MnhB domain-containing protein, partial [Frankia sp. EI5c]|uniref:MnhB domain-containing protein n=1 Tax=Frankia sp. EI5c TaxID=683316 RepID=UPI00210073F3